MIAIDMEMPNGCLECDLNNKYGIRCKMYDCPLIEIEQSEDKVTISFDKGTLKHSDKDYVVYNKDWLRKHFATEVKIMTGHEGYKQSDDCVSLKEVEKWLHQHVTISIPSVETQMFEQLEKELPRVTPTQSWIPLVWDEYPTVDSEGNDDWVYSIDYSVPMPKEDEWVLITDENHNVRVVQYDGYDFGDYVREHILAWAHSPMPYKD